MREDYQVLIDEISGSLGTPATLEDRGFGLIAFGAHEGPGGGEVPPLDPVRTRSILRRRSTAAVRAWFESFGITRARSPVRIPPDPSAGVHTGRLCLPARHGGVVYGYVWLLDDGALDLTDPRLERAQETAFRIGSLLAAEAQAGAHAGEALRELLTAAAGARQEAAAGLRATLGGSVPESLAQVAISPWPPAAGVPTGLPGVVAHCVVPTDAPAEPFLEGGAAARSSHTDTHPPSEGVSALALLVRLRHVANLTPAHTVARRALGLPPTTSDTVTSDTSGVRAGISVISGGLSQAPAAWRRCLATARAARAEPGLGTVAEWGAIGPYRLLATLEAGAEPDTAVRTLLNPAHREMARTAETFLDCAGQAGRTATTLGVHRQTLYYRLSRVEQLTGLDLDQGEDRLLLHMALKITRLARAQGRPDGEAGRPW